LEGQFFGTTTNCFWYTENTMKCALYARVSTEQKRGRQDPEVQLRQLRRFAVTQGWKVTQEYVDRETGAKADRAQFQCMLTDASKRKFDVLLFWSIDRFSREGILPVLTHMKRLSDYGVKYRSFEEPYIDTTHEFGDLLAAFAAKLAELERKRIKARVKAGLEAARAKGKTLGRPRVVVNRAKVWALKDAGRSIRDIAATMKLSHGTVQRALAAR
jgi:DNA invertase Pin-like site-specific DNA recombinase